MKRKGMIPFTTEKHQPELSETKRRDLIAEGVRLTAEAGRLEQRQRAEQRPPPRTILRALTSMQKPGRRGRKAKAKVRRVLLAKLGPKAVRGVK